MMDHRTISLVIAVFPNERVGALSHQPTREMLATQLSTLYEYVFVNDGVDDNSLNELLEIHNGSCLHPVRGSKPLHDSDPDCRRMLKAMIGLIGEYLCRIYDGVKAKPNHIIRKMY